MYFSVAPRGTDITFSEIRNKKLKYDNFDMKYKLGEWVEVTDSYTYTFSIPDIEKGLDQELKIFVQNTDGIVASAIRYRFSTIEPETPMKVYALCKKGANLDTIFNSIKGLIASGARLTNTNPKPELYYIESHSEGLTIDPKYPILEFTSGILSSRSGIKSTRTSLFKSSLTNS